MKTKQFEKRLTLNKKTIADLSDEQMNRVKGGCASRPGETSCNTYWCTYILTCPAPKTS
jgi:natural product precursor